ncbi:hypothetical protein BGZ90_003367 [Linnemannia elongata]|nr:hypothetical protein BGZ90_003367 [Linnemannia elongata]
MEYVFEELRWYVQKRQEQVERDFDINPDGKVKAKSYINNLHPVEHKEMYPVLEGILEKFLPMFEEVLGEMKVLETEKKR